MQFSEFLSTLKSAFEAERGNEIACLTRLFQDPDITTNLLSIGGGQFRLSEFVEQSRADVSEIAVGYALFFLFHAVAMEQDVSAVVKSEINTILHCKPLLNCITAIYGLPIDLGLEAAALHKTGTTSIILKAHSQRYGLCAVKLLQVPYLNHPSLTNASLDYKKRYGLHVKHSARVFDSGARWMVMEFVEGDNLQDFLQNIRYYPLDRRVPIVTEIFIRVSQALAYYADLNPPISHGDLSPWNILVVYDGDKIEDLVLIDFGQNYVLRERAGSRTGFTKAMAQVELYCAPEVVSGTATPSLRSDLYSLGMIAANLLSEMPLRRDTLGSQLREIWKSPRASGVARLIEDLIDDDPNKRGLLLNADYDGSIYRLIGSLAKDQADSLVEIERDSHAGFLSRFDWRQSLNDIRARYKLANNKFEYIDRWQLIASYLNAVCVSGLVVAVLAFTGFDVAIQLGLNANIPQTLTLLTKWLPLHYELGDTWGNLPGRAVALTFGLIAARYYSNIYAALRVENPNRVKERLTNFVLRFNSWSYLPPIMYAIVISPRAWPYCAFLGVLFPTLNNALCHIYARTTVDAASKSLSVVKYHRDATDEFLTRYHEWWVQMGAYAAMLLVVGLLLQWEIAQDEIVYAAIVCGINMVKIYRNNCFKEAPSIRGQLTRVFSTAARLQKLPKN